MKMLGVNLSNSAEWKKFQKDLTKGKNWTSRAGYLPERPEVAKKRLAREARNDMIIAKKENRPSFYMAHSTSQYYDQDKALYEKFRKDLSTKAYKLDYHLKSQNYDMQDLKDLFRNYTDAK